VRVVLADDGIQFDGKSAAGGPLGGAETAFVALAEALAARGNAVTAISRCDAPLTYNGVAWAPLASGPSEGCDLYIANRGAGLLGLVPRARRRVLWLHNPARYLKKPRNLWPLARYQPILVAIGRYHVSTVPWFANLNDLANIPYGLLPVFRGAKLRDPPPPRAIFTSNPLRGLDWLLDVWTSRIQPAVPEAELHILSGPAVYRNGAARHAPQMEAVLARADALHGHGVRRHAPVGREALAFMLTGARVMLYRGDPGETFCLALAEAQAMGVPAVVQPLGSAGERVIDGQTGCVAASAGEFAEAAIAVLRDDELWRRWHRAALATQRGLSWDEVAARFETLMV
jgi:glycosyltransferase involved in cell wall biosynthesis